MIMQYVLIDLHSADFVNRNSIQKYAKMFLSKYFYKFPWIIKKTSQSAFESLCNSMKDCW